MTSHIILKLLYPKVGVDSTAICISYACLFDGGHFKSPWVDTSIVKYYELVEMLLAYRVGELNVCGRVGWNHVT